MNKNYTITKFMKYISVSKHYVHDSIRSSLANMKAMEICSRILL